MPFAATSMNLDRDYYIKQSKSERERQISYDIIYMWNIKYDTNEHIYESETDSQTESADLWLSRGMGWEEKYWESGFSRCK